MNLIFEFINKSNGDTKKLLTILEESNNSIIESVLLESEIKWQFFQFFLIRDLIDSEPIIHWGYDNFENWDNYSDIIKTKYVFSYLMRTGALEEIRNYVDATIPKTGTNIYKINDITAAVGTDQFVIQLKSSPLFSIIKDMLLQKFAVQYLGYKNKSKTHQDIPKFSQAL